MTSTDRLSDLHEEGTMSEQPRQQYEKEEEKEREKQHEKEDEKNVEEKWKRDPLGTAVWAAILIWAGIVLLAGNLGYLDAWARSLGLGGLEDWNYIFLGAGVILLVEVLVRLTIATYRRPVVGTAIVALVFFGIGLGDKFGWDLVGPAILIIIGLSILFRGLMPKR
jgi:hypothetical protein